MISIGCLIYRSVAYCEFVAESLRKHTPHLHDGRAEFYFVANDATAEIRTHLRNKGYRHFIQDNSLFSDDEREQRYLAKPEYLIRVYRGCNRIFSEARGDTCVMVSSDMSFSPSWLDALMEQQDGNRIVTSQLVEPPDKANTEDGSIPQSFGKRPSEFMESEFLAFAERTRGEGTRVGGQYVPVCIPMSVFHKNGGYPEGNIHTGDEFGLAGDKALHRRYATLGTPHVTALGSVVYHFVEGEKDE